MTNQGANMPLDSDLLTRSQWSDFSTRQPSRAMFNPLD